ncbi:histidine phosphatase family protein [Daejeonella sp.]|uniref:SixA phosphatase family protein n=1 Tax=Daejeonella sp. TaxID=2805397 RepID=UPI0027312AC3|nr:phosphoglycerate mutase family protein [Daejeonella sp.]MDP2414280.1 phosphoglycerate mutase family protein [Daejeonella sp.]
MIKRRVFMFCLLVSAFMTLSARAQTSVWIVRHAEKDMKNPSDPDPPLSIDGQERAKELAALLRPKRLLAVYSTPFKRTMQTAQPTAYARGLTVQTYDPADLEAFAASVLRQHKGGAVLIVGHSNTVLELVEAFGIKRPIEALSDDVYDYVFNVAVQGNSIQLLTSQYGKLHRTAAPK